MGMFDTIHCSYDLGPGFHNKTLQTKDISSTMSEFWLSPNGELYLIDYSGTQDFVLGDQPPFHKPNGCRGRVVATEFHGRIEVYPEVWTAHYAPFPRLMLTFIHGKIQDTIQSIKKFKKSYYYQPIDYQTLSEEGFQE